MIIRIMIHMGWSMMSLLRIVHNQVICNKDFSTTKQRKTSSQKQGGLNYYRSCTDEGILA